MAYDLSNISTPAYVAGKYGQALSQGSGGSTQDMFVGLTSYTMEAWVKLSSTGAIRVIAGSAGCAWIGMNANGTARGSYGNSNGVDLNGPVINDGAWHHVALCASSTAGGALWVDGVKVDSSATNADATIPREFAVRYFGGVGGFVLPVGDLVDDLAVSTVAKYTTAFTPGPVLNSQPNLRAVYHFDGDALNYAGQPDQPSGDTTPPSAITDIVFSGITNSGYTASWAAATDNVGVVGYKFDDGSGTFSDIGNVLTRSVTGKAANTAYTVRVYGYDAAGNQATAYSEQVTTSASAATFDVTKVKFSPGNWDVQSGLARTICAGAYFETLFGGTSCALSFDMTGVTTPYPVIAYRVDEYGPWQIQRLAATVNIQVPSATAPQATHFLRMEVLSTSQAVDRWNGACAVKLTGITLDSGKALALAPSLPLSGWYYGDSITEGTNTLNNSGDNTDRSSVSNCWSYLSARNLGAEFGIIGFGSQGLTVQGAGNVPIFNQAYDKQFAGVTRSFSKAPDFVVINQGTNDSGSITANGTAVLNGLLAALPSSTKIIVLRPFNGSHDAQWVAAIAACSAPSRINYVDTTGWFNTANAPDALHPSGYENIWHIAPQATAAIKAVLNNGVTPGTTARTVSLTLGDTTGALANLTGIKVAAFDEPTPDLRSAPRYKSSTQTTNASGVLSFTMQSTLAAGALCGVSVQLADGRNFDVTATVA